jgi:hypothetical protein
MRGMETQTDIAVTGFEARLRTATIVHWAILASGVMFIVMAEMIGPKIRMETPPDILVLAFGFLAAVNAAVAFFVHKRLVSGSEEALRRNSDDPVAAQRWMQGTILTVALCESVIVIGFVMRLVGAANAAVWPFYAGGLLLMLLFVPRRP